MIYKTHVTDPAKIKDPSHKHWIYCGLDTCVTAEVMLELQPKLNSNQRRTYDFEQACQGPSLTMQLRGIRIDEPVRVENLKLLKHEALDMRGDLDTLAVKHQGRPFNWGKGYAPSTQQLQKLLYDSMGITPIYHRVTGNRTADKEALAKIAKKNSAAKPICDKSLSLRDWQKQIEVLEKGASDDGRFHFTMAIGQTETGRASSYKDPYGLGDNIQNKDKRLRNMFIPDPGWEMINPDLEQAESRVIAYVAGDEAYIQAHEDGNVHISTAKIFWPDFGFSADVVENAERLKSTPVPWLPGEHFTYYDMSKRGQHGLNYGLTYFGLAQWIGSTQEEAKRYWGRYFAAYPMIQEYHKYVAATLKETRKLTTPLGMERQFFNRYWEKPTIREAIAFVPQSVVGQICWLGIWRVWDRWDPDRVKVLQNGHDSMLAQVRPDDLTIKSLVADALTVKVPVRDFYNRKERMMVIPVEMSSGKNWRDCK